MKGFLEITSAQVIEWTRRFVSWPSEQTAAMERDTAVQAFVREGVGSFIEHWSMSHRFDALGNLIVEIGPADAQCELAIFAYAMTHPRAQMESAFSATLIETPRGRALRGRGVAEQKAAVAASLAAVVDIDRTRRLARNCAWILLTAGETGRHDAIESALQALGRKPRLAIIAVGTGGRVSLGNRGRLDVNVTIRGRSCHSSTPWLGADVTDGIREILERAQKVGSTLGRHTTLGPATLTCTAIHTAPAATHTLQSEACLTFDRRLLPDEDPEVAFQVLRETLSVQPPLIAEHGRGDFMYGHELGEGHAALSTLKEATRLADLGEPEIYWSSGALDAGYLQQQEIAAVMWGPGDPAQFHTDDERITVTELLGMAENYRAVIDHLSSPARLRAET